MMSFEVGVLWFGREESCLAIVLTTGWSLTLNSGVGEESGVVAWFGDGPRRRSVPVGECARLVLDSLAWMADVEVVIMVTSTQKTVFWGQKKEI